ncbi:glutathione S-transferase [Klebsiella sp. RIT-PI-d]|uniref:glutathione transferase GstA n=1 Tax=Klebsiella sp. RIT-PI-d TaxID=1681196 RepID=UPI000675F978|nr:glutathione transferase GstA [Klebsiella sp. RIT-PI-d]KNC09094.1 glutathione S-transferase [Klebsiella sp. RIT-PI-d]
MKLYYAPNTCSLSPHIVLRELELEFELVKVDNKSKQTSDGRDFLSINPKGYVAALELEDGEILTEGPAIVQFLADLKPDRALAPLAGSWDRVRLQEWLNFITSEIHAGSALLFSPRLPEEVKSLLREKLLRRFDLLEETLSRKAFLTGAFFTVADAYLYTVLRWCKYFAIELKNWPVLTAYIARINERPAVQAALIVEASC